MSDIAKMIAIAKKFGGGSSTPAPVVILPETELTLSNDIHLTIPWNVEPVDGGVYRVTFCGVEYECKGVGAAEDGMTAVLIGNIPAGLGLTGGNPDMPVMLVCYSNAFGAETGMYCEVQVVDTEWVESWGGTAPALTLSIVQTEGGSDDSGSGMFIVTSPDFSISEETCTFDKTFAETLAAYKAGHNVVFRISTESAEITLPVALAQHTNGNISVLMGQTIAESALISIGMFEDGTGEVMMQPLAFATD